MQFPSTTAGGDSAGSDWLSVAEAASSFSLAEETIRRAARNGLVRTHHHPWGRRVAAVDVQQLAALRLERKEQSARSIEARKAQRQEQRRRPTTRPDTSSKDNAAVRRYVRDRQGQLKPLAMTIVEVVSSGITAQAELRKHAVTATGAGDSTVRLTMRLLVHEGILVRVARGWYKLGSEQ